MTQSTDTKTNSKKKLLEIYRKGNFIYAEGKTKLTKKDWHQIIGVYSTLIEMVTKNGDEKWVN